MKSIVTKYLGPTDRRGSRIKASDCDNNSVVVGLDHELSIEDAHAKAARALCKKMGWTGKMAWGVVIGGYVYVLIGRNDFNIVEI